MFFHIYLRGHLHYKYFAGEQGVWEGRLLGACQSPETKYGRVLSKGTDTSIEILTIEDNGDLKWKVETYQEEPEMVFPLCSQ